tara:strand:- start:192 stop:1310 length:1119 start_codon:yes stop_codon:yes gene_type:complete
MLRRQEYSVDLGEVSYVAPPKKRCVSKSERLNQIKKEACGVGVLKPYDVDEFGTTITKIKGNMLGNMEKLNNQYKAHGCDPMRPSCVKMITCKAKTSTLHDGTENVSHDIVGLGVKEDGNMGNLYNSYRDVKIVDTDALIQSIRDGNAPIQDQITKDAEYKARLYGSSYGVLDGTPTGYTCIPDCPKTIKPCLKYPPVCKIPDPNNAETGIGSDLMESKDSLMTLFEARRVDNKVAVSDFTQTEGVRPLEQMMIKTNLPDDEMQQDLARTGSAEIRQTDREIEEIFSPTSTETTGRFSPTSTVSVPPSEAGAMQGNIEVPEGMNTGQAIASGRRGRGKGKKTIDREQVSASGQATIEPFFAKKSRKGKDPEL